MGTSVDFGGSPKWGTEKGQITSAGTTGLSSEDIRQMLSAVISTLPPPIIPPSIVPETPGAPDVPGLQPEPVPTKLAPARAEPGEPTVTIMPTRFSGSGGGGGGGSGTGSPSIRSGSEGGSKNSSKGGGQRGGGRGRSAVHAAGNLGHFITTVASEGLQKAAEGLGISLKDKTPIQISEALTEALCGPQSTIDEVALHNAMSELLGEFFEKASTAQELEASLTKAAPSVKSILTKFFGNYIFQRFCMLSYAGMLAKHGVQQAEAALKQVKIFIKSKIANLAADRNLASINWKGSEGLVLVEKIRLQTEEVFSV